MSREVKINKELVAKIGTEEEKAWSDIKKDATEKNKELTRVIQINEQIIKYADTKIKEEKGKV